MAYATAPRVENTEGRGPEIALPTIKTGDLRPARLPYFSGLPIHVKFTAIHARKLAHARALEDDSHYERSNVY
jgi:hypothetical protein